MNQILICTLPILRRLLRDLAGDRRAVLLRVGLRQTSSGFDWLARDIVPSSPGNSSFLEMTNTWIVQRADRPPSGSDALPPDVTGRLDLGGERWRGRAWGLVRTPLGIEPLDQLVLVGAGMHRIDTRNRRPAERQIEKGGRLEAPDPRRWSRTIGALGGLDIWRRLISLRIGIVGCGRSGSVAAASLARLGLRRLVLIDPDIAEHHNLGEMDAISANHLDWPKAQAVADDLERTLADTRIVVTPVVASLTRPDALEAARACDVLFCCADNDAARLACGLIATLDHKVLLDIGTGIHFEGAAAGAGGGTREMGADVRLILAGDGCLLCRGRLAHLARALDELCYPIRSRAAPADEEQWRRQRAGSLASMNHLAVAVAVQMLQDLVAERIRSSMWAQLEFDESGRLAVRYPEAAGRGIGEPLCALCAKAGLGDEGLRP
jgi:hypothetical protein